MRKLLKLKLRAKTSFNTKTAMSFSRTDYYRACIQNYKMDAFIQSEKRRLATSKKDIVRGVIKKWKEVGQTGPPSKYKVINSIAEKNSKIAEKEKKENIWGENSKPPIHSNLIGIVSDPNILMMAYRTIRGNRGTMTKAMPITKDKLTKLSEQEQEKVVKFYHIPDGKKKKKASP